MTESVGRWEDVKRWVVEVSRDLKLPASNPEDDFFDVGGTSLTLIRFIARVETQLGVVLDPDDILEDSTFRGIAATILAKEDQAAADLAAETSP